MISITLPSIYPDALERTLTNIRDTTKTPHEIIVVSSFEPPKIAGLNADLVWVQETVAAGCNAAHGTAAKYAKGHYITAWVDDHTYVDGWDEIAIDDFEFRERMSGWPFLLGLRQVGPPFAGTVFGIYYAYFPFMRTYWANKLGWFSNAYFQDFADVSLSFKVWAAKGTVEWSKEGLITPHHDDKRKTGRVTNQKDMDTFIHIWKPMYGNGWDTSHLRGFNVDHPIPPDATYRTIRPK